MTEQEPATETAGTADAAIYRWAPEQGEASERLVLSAFTASERRGLRPWGGRRLGQLGRYLRDARSGHRRSHKNDEDAQARQHHHPTSRPRHQGSSCSSLRPLLAAPSRSDDQPGPTAATTRPPAIPATNLSAMRSASGRHPSSRRVRAMVMGPGSGTLRSPRSPTPPRGRPNCYAPMESEQPLCDPGNATSSPDPAQAGRPLGGTMRSRRTPPVARIVPSSPMACPLWASTKETSAR